MSMMMAKLKMGNYLFWNLKIESESR